MGASARCGGSGATELARTRDIKACTQQNVHREQGWDAAWREGGLGNSWNGLPVGLRSESRVQLPIVVCAASRSRRCALTTCGDQPPGEGGEALEARLEAVLDVVRGLCAGDPLSCAPARCIAPDGTQLAGAGDGGDGAGWGGACGLEEELGGQGGDWPGEDVRSARDDKFEKMVGPKP
ncbi:hypothetical protein T484DRAFT_1903847 [Baffinella frigidus]|nr:hypothetical protein T484DRAFT_1903847 [Cryptophyta sp. CCMP2293]